MMSRALTINRHKKRDVINFKTNDGKLHIEMVYTI